jgi:SAM-dependent methyltransferase
MYDPKYVQAFYDAYGIAEWDRLGTSRPYGYLQWIIHSDFLKRYLKPGISVLDAGSGPGRYAIETARIGAKITLLDISKRQLEIARQKLNQAGYQNKVESYIQGDICDLSQFPDATFDAVVCFGGALTYVCQKRKQAASELMRITRPDGIILVSVMSLFGAVLSTLTVLQMLKDPNNPTFGVPGLWDVLNSGDLSGARSGSVSMAQPPMHLYTAEDLRALFAAYEILEIAGSNVTIRPSSPQVQEIFSDPNAWATVVELERRLCTNPGLINSGHHIIMAVRR